MTRSEEKLHQQIAAAWHNTHLPNSGVYNERQRLICNWTNSENSKSGNKARTMGVKKGVPDWMYLKPDGKIIWIELKTETGKLSSEQKDFQELCGMMGHAYYICKTLKDFFDLIENC